MARTTAERRSVPLTAPSFPRLGHILWTLVLYGLLLALCLFILLPIGWMLTAALKPDTAPIFTFPPQWFPTEYWHWETFKQTLFGEETRFLRYALNSTLLVVLNVIGAALSGAMIAYPFARMRFRGKNILFTILIATMLLPGPVLLIPQFLLFYKIGWYGTYLPLVVPAYTGNAFFVFLLRQYMRTIPKDLDEAARIDGAGYWTIFWRVILPLSAPALTVVAVFQFVATWNDFFGPLIYLDDPDKFTIAVGLASYLTKVGTQWNQMMAANLIAIIPVLVVYFLAQKQLIGGIASVGIKG